MAWERGSKGPASPGGGEGICGYKDPRDGSEEGGETPPGCLTHLDGAAQQRVQLEVGRLCPGWSPEGHLGNSQASHQLQTSAVAQENQVSLFVWSTTLRVYSRRYGPPTSQEKILFPTRLETAPTLNSSSLSGPARPRQRLALLPYDFPPGLYEQASHPVVSYSSEEQTWLHHSLPKRLQLSPAPSDQTA